MAQSREQVVADVDDELIEEEESEPYFLDIDELQKHGINVSDIQKLKKEGICTVMGVVQATRRNMCKVKGLSEAKVEKIKEAAAKLQNSSFITAAELGRMRSQVMQISTGSEELNKLIGGGVESMSITEIFGEFRTGKTQITHTLCVTTQLPVNQGGAAGKAAVIDTEGTFRPDRIRQIAERFGMDADSALENVVFARAYNSEQILDLIVDLAARFAEEKVYRLLVVDSIIATFRSDYSGRGELAERQQKLNQVLSRLTKLAEEFNVAVVITNQMTSDPGATLTFVADPKKPTGGNILAHASTTRLQLRKGRGETRICKVYDSPNMPEAEAMFAISEGGIIDAKE